MEYLLDSASSYAPTDTVSLENVMFLYQVSPGSEGIVVHGFNRIGNALFSVYAILGDGNEVLVEGTSDQTASSGTALLIETPKCYVFPSNQLTSVLESTTPLRYSFWPNPLVC